MADRQRDTNETIQDLATANQKLAEQLAASERQNRERDPISEPRIASDREHSIARPDRRHPGRRLARALTWPVRRVFDPRFGGLAQQIDAKQIDLFDRLDHLRDEALAINHERTVAHADLIDLVKSQDEQLALAVGLLEAQLEASAEATAILGRTLVEVRTDTEGAGHTLRSVQMLLEELQEATAELRKNLVGTGELDTVTEEAARLLNFADSHLGFAAQRQLWINHPVSLEYTAGDVRVANVNERIVEIPYAIRALSNTAPPARILDVGAVESTLSLSLASLGYRVTAVDLRPYPFRHPNLEVIEGTIATVPDNGSFDAAMCISTIEHIGLDAYGRAPADAGGDLETMGQLHRLLRTGGTLVLTVPFGAAGVDELQRTYDRPALDRLFDGWRVLDLTVISRRAKTGWVPASVEEAQDSHAVALVTAQAG